MQMTKAIPPKHIVLYADDDVDDLMLIEEAFSQYANNVELITACDGIEALHYLESLEQFDAAPCLIILDVNMPRLNGKETLRRLRNLQRFQDTPVVLFTTSSLPLDKVFAQKFKAGFVTKPIDAKQMAHIADQFVEHCEDEIKKNIRKQLN